MKIGVLRERMLDERRVALRPDQVKNLVDDGHQVWVETKAGILAGFEDDSYKQAGASVSAQQEVYKQATLLLKVKCPIVEEYKFLSSRHILFTYLHFDENIAPENIQSIIGTGVAGIAYEWVEDNGAYPLLYPMSELTGAVFARKSMSLLTENAGLLGGKYVPGWPSAKCMIIGVGRIGANAANVFLRNGFELVIVDKHPETLDERITKYTPTELWTQSKPAVNIIQFDEDHPEESVDKIRAELPTTRILINAAVRRRSFPKERCEFLVDRAGVKSMQKNSVVCDATACDCDFIETAISSASLTEHYVEEGVIHYNCSHIPSLIANTATQMLTSVTFPFVLDLLEGFEHRVTHNSCLAKGVMCYRGHLTHSYSAEKKHLPYTPLESLISK